ncbi:MAG: hypothetical protein KatS3mg055_1095 [Chloroflexus sp.]|nr:MAG: hypothetical protein KatS3mg055_1095 [Chloroflexus sp.]
MGARYRRTPTGGVLYINVFAPFASFAVFASASFALRLSCVGARHRRAPTGGVLYINVFAPFALFAVFALTAFAPSAIFVGHGMPFPYGWWPVRQHPLRLCALCGLCVNGLCALCDLCGARHAVPLRVVFYASTSLRSLPPLRSLREQPLCYGCPAWGTAPPYPYGWRSMRQRLCVLCPLCGLCVSILCVTVVLRGARHRRAPTGGVLCVNTFAFFAPSAPLREQPLRSLRSLWGTAPPCPYGWRSVRQRLCVLCGLCGLCVNGLCVLCDLCGARHAVPLRVAFYASTSLRSLPPLRSLRQHPLRYGCPAWGTAPPCPYGWRSVRQHPLRLCALCGLCVSNLCDLCDLCGARHRRAPTGGVLCVNVFAFFAPFAVFA